MNLHSVEELSIGIIALVIVEQNIEFVDQLILHLERENKF